MFAKQAELVEADCLLMVDKGQEAEERDNDTCNWGWPRLMCGSVSIISATLSLPLLTMCPDLRLPIAFTGRSEDRSSPGGGRGQQTGQQGYHCSLPAARPTSRVCMALRESRCDAYRHTRLSGALQSP